MCNITTALRILIYNILVLQNKVINAICVDGAWSHYGKYQYALQSHTLETLEFKFEMAKNARANLTKLRKRKLLQFCLHFRLTINEVEEYIKLNIDSDNCYVKKLYSKLLILRKQMLKTLNVESSKRWVKRYLRVMKNYKSEATFMSTLLRGCKIYLSEHPHFAFLEEISTTCISHLEIIG